MLILNSRKTISVYKSHLLGEQLAMDCLVRSLWLCYISSIAHFLDYLLYPATTPEYRTAEKRRIQSVPRLVEVAGFSCFMDKVKGKTIPAVLQNTTITTEE